jgi:hypothetical protein
VHYWLRLMPGTSVLEAINAMCGILKTPQSYRSPVYTKLAS